MSRATLKNDAGQQASAAKERMMTLVSQVADPDWCGPRLAAIREEIGKVGASVAARARTTYGQVSTTVASQAPMMAAKAQEATAAMRDKGVQLARKGGSRPAAKQSSPEAAVERLEAAATVAMIILAVVLQMRRLKRKYSS